MREVRGSKPRYSSFLFSAFSPVFPLLASLLVTSSPPALRAARRGRKSASLRQQPAGSKACNSAEELSESWWAARRAPLLHPPHSFPRQPHSPPTAQTAASHAASAAPPQAQECVTCRVKRCCGSDDSLMRKNTHFRVTQSVWAGRARTLFPGAIVQSLGPHSHPCARGSDACAKALTGPSSPRPSWTRAPARRGRRRASRRRARRTATR